MKSDKCRKVPFLYLAVDPAGAHKMREANASESCPHKPLPTLNKTQGAVSLLRSTPHVSAQERRSVSEPILSSSDHAYYLPKLTWMSRGKLTSLL